MTIPFPILSTLALTSVALTAVAQPATSQFFQSGNDLYAWMAARDPFQAGMVLGYITAVADSETHAKPTRLGAAEPLQEARTNGRGVLCSRGGAGLVPFCA